MIQSNRIFTIDELSSIIEREISNLNLQKKPENLYLPISHILKSGGKRIRPVLVLAATNLFSDNIDYAIHPAIAVEIFHNFTLVHDDIMDNALQRRGIDTVHSKWNTNIAILSGDAMSIIAYSLIGKTHEIYISKVLKIFNEFALGICEGQQLDMDFEKRMDVAVTDYLKMIELKTSVLIKGSLQIGAVLGGADDEQIDKIGSFGLNLGLAFQLQDDLLDLYGNAAIFGKKTGGDIIAKKKTILYLNALRLTNNDSTIINLYQSDSNNSDIKVKDVTNIFNKLKIREITEKQISDYHRAALKSLEEIEIIESRKATIRTIANNIMKREK